MYDIHCHLLPEIDDGPPTLKESLALAEQALENGVSHAVMTPHIHFGRWDNSRACIRMQTLIFKKALADAGIELKVSCAAELRISPELMSLHHENQIPMLGRWQGKDVILLEFPHSHIPPGADKISRWFLERNVLPMIAHPERNKDVMRSLDKLEPFVKMGCLFQLTAGSVVGRFGDAAKMCAHELLRRGVVTVLASDAHHIKRRPVNLYEGYDKSAEIIGRDNAWKLVQENPRAIVGGHFISFDRKSATDS